MAYSQSQVAWREHERGSSTPRVLHEVCANWTLVHGAPRFSTDTGKESSSSGTTGSVAENVIDYVNQHLVSEALISPLIAVNPLVASTVFR